MATYIPLENLPVQIVDNNGDTLMDGTLEFYLAGTTTETELFADNSGTSIGTSITLNSWGMPESGGNTITLFRDQSKAIKIIAKTSAGITIFTSDNIPAQAFYDTTASEKLDAIEAKADVTDATNVAAAGALMTDGSKSMSGDLAFDGGAYIKWSVTAGITASITQTQGEVPLTAGLNEVSTVANTNDVITLPTAVAGRQVVIINNGANTMQIFPDTDDAISGGAVDAAVTLASGSNVIYCAYDVINWEAV